MAFMIDSRLVPLGMIPIPLLASLDMQRTLTIQCHSIAPRSSKQSTIGTEEHSNLAKAW